jgi:glycosyltransferase involved in cell wall biosynthesis
MLAVIMPNAKRILLLVTQADWGGVQSFLIRFATRLIAEGHTVLLAAGGEGELWKEARAHGIPARQLRHMERDVSPFKDLLAIRELRQLLKEFQPDAIHLNSSKMGILGSLAAAARTRPWIAYRIGGWAFLEPMPRWKKWMYRTAERLTARCKDVIITVHPGDEELAKKLGFHARHHIVTVPNGLDLAALATKLKPKSEARRELGLPEHAFVFGTIANAYPAKALLPYLDVLNVALQKDQSVYAVIIGDGPEFEALRQKRDELGLTERVLLPGHRDDAATLHMAFDAFVLPSRKEGMPWALLEAMAAGTPCIATDVGACHWMLESGGSLAGLIVPPEQGPALVDAMQKLRQDATLRARLSAAAKNTILQRFTWETTYRGNLKALERIG